MTSAPQNETGRRRVRRIGDVLFESVSTFSGSMILALLAAVFFFLLLQGVPAFAPGAAEDSEFLHEARNLADPDGEGNFFWYVLPLVFGTLWASLLALIIAVPVSILVALFITHYAPRKLAAVLGYVVELLAAVPSVVFGLWGATVLGPAVQPSYVWLNTRLDWLPFFSGQVSATGKTILTAAIVLAVMILPIITSLTREVFLQTPRLHEEAALALGATRWEMIRMAVLPFARSGMVSSVMLGLGRALGETMAVAMVLSASGVVTLQLTSNTNPSTIAANIALSFPESSKLDINVLIASGLVLFAITLIVNSIARWIVSRRNAFPGAK